MIQREQNKILRIGLCSCLNLNPGLPKFTKTRDHTLGHGVFKLILFTVLSLETKYALSKTTGFCSVSQRGRTWMIPSSQPDSPALKCHSGPCPKSDYWFWEIIKDSYTSTHTKGIFPSLFLSGLSRKVNDSAHKTKQGFKTWFQKYKLHLETITCRKGQISNVPLAPCYIKYY